GVVPLPLLAVEDQPLTALMREHDFAPMQVGEPLAVADIGQPVGLSLRSSVCVLFRFFSRLDLGVVEREALADDPVLFALVHPHSATIALQHPPPPPPLNF